MSQELPTVLFFAGAFADPSCFDTFSKLLQTAGYPTAYAYVPSLNPSDPTAVSSSQDAQVTSENYLLPLLNQGKDVVIFAHSYGGIVGGAAAAGLSKASRAAAGMPGGVIGLIYCVGNIVGEGESLLQAVGGAYPPFIQENQPSKGLAVISPVIQTLYGEGAVSPETIPELEAAMTPHSLKAFETPQTAPAWAESAFDGRRAYIRTIDDQCNPLFIQDIWIEKTAVKWKTVDVKSGHCPFITQPEELAEIAVTLIKSWT
ncbi:alpha/beta-hydrolase [Periconia macrospinosa]|uniref:Alpha/beta-hydrolase n=1 Tax=Periconia macrospinosa TaxID=97972 RepID=A0A2V1DDH2_9PLEO|nr:alpha/beta-hydrolase [Periconia macrospinosa]